MTKIGITEDELFPAYWLNELGDYDIDVAPETVARWKAAWATFMEAQDEMGDVYEQAKADRDRTRAIEKAQKEADAAQAKLDRLLNEWDAKNPRPARRLSGGFLAGGCEV